MTERTIVAAYHGQTQLFRAFERNGEILSAPEHLSNSDRRRIDALVFRRSDDHLLFWTPVVPASVTNLEVRAPGSDGELKIECTVRCFISGPPDPDVANFSMTIERLHGVLTVTNMSVMGDLLESAPALDAVLAVTFQSRYQGRETPTMLEKLGLTVPHSFTNPRVIASFVERVALPEGYVLRFTVERQLDDKRRQRVRPLGMEFDAGELDGGKLTIWQRPPLDGAVPGGVSHWVVEFPCSSPFAASQWNRAIVKPYLDSLRTVEGKPLSVIPTLETTDPRRWTTRLSLVGDIPSGELKPEHFDFSIPNERRRPDVISILGRSVEPARSADTGAHPVVVTANLEQFRRTDAGRPLAWPAWLRRLADESLEANPDDHRRGYRFSIQQLKVAPRSEDHAQRVRLGALELAFPSGPQFEPPVPYDTGAPGTMEVRFRLRERLSSEAASDDAPGLVQVETLDIRLGVVGVLPGGQDDVPGEEFAEEFETSAETTEQKQYERSFRRGTPLLVNRNSQESEVQLQNAAASPPFWLQAVESALPGKSQTVELTLRRIPENPAASFETRLIVIDKDPFLIAEVQIDDLQTDLKNAITAEIGNYSNRSGAAWELSAGAQGFRLALPPQGVGEAMEKGKHDDGVDDISENTPIDFRFTPLATFALQPSYFEQRFAEVPWNLRRILGYPGQREPGAGVDKLEFELLYGLRCRVTAPSLRLAEIAARLGSLPGRQPRTLPWKADGLQGAVYQRYRALWQRLYQGLRSRLSILEPWNAERAGALLLKEGVEFELRPTAHLRFPALLAKPDDAPNVPAGAQDPNGLAGGIGWGFESVNIYNALWRNPKSVAGELSRPFFSALGGWGHQKASFDGGLTTVYSDTAMGRTSSISIERIGRVGVFWNRAKHVIIYERTVAPSRQFYLEQDPLRGVPALRKVREYVEILQPDRRFPEYGAAPVTRGFVNGLTFPETSRIINVNSRWGTDVGREGWKVPLWVRGAEPRDVYPKPQITFRVTADQPGADVHLPIDQPEKLCFFTSTNPGHDADPELWPSIEHVDFAYLGELAPPDPGFLNGDTGVPNSKPEVPVILGSGPFTFTLEPAGRAVNVVTERTEAIVGAALRNLTLMRGGVPRPGGDMLDAGRILNHALDGLTNPFEQFLAPLPNRAAALPPAVVTTEIDRLRDRLTSELTGAYADIKSALGAGGVEDKICAAVVSRVKAQFVILERQVFEILDRLRSDLLARLRIIAPDTLTNPEWDAVKDPVKAAIEDAFTRVRTLVKVVHGTTGEFTARIDDGILRANDIAASVQSDIQRAREVVETQWNVGNPLPVQGEITKLRVVAEHALAALDFATAEVARHYTGGASDMIRTRVSTAVKDAEAAARKAQLLVRDLQAVTEGDVVVQLDALVTTVETIRKMVEDGLKQWKNSATQVGGATTELDELLGHLRDALEAAVVASPSPSEFFRRYVAEAQSFLDAQSTRLRKAIDDVETKIADHAKALCSVVFATRDELHAALDAILNPQRLHALLEDLGGLAPTAEELRREVGALQDGMTGRLREYLDRARATVNPDGTVGVLTDNTLRLFRAFGAAPHVPNLDFEIPKLELPAWGIDGVDGVLRDVGYYFAPERATVLITPLLAKANELKDVLNPASLKVPSKELLDRIIPVALEKFDLSTVFPHFAGLDLGNLFSNLKLPEIATDKVQVTHGIDPQSQRGWLEINVDVPYGVKPATVFAFAGVTMRLLRARFQAVSRVEAAVGEAPRHTFRGSIRGDWDIQVGGFPVAVIVDTALRFDDGGHLRFEVSPDRVKLQSVLAFLSELVAKFGFSEKGFTVRVLPTGIQSVLDLPLPDVQAGAFGLANLRLGFTFELRVLPEFRLGAHLAVSSRYRPFTMTIFILGGAGWVDVAVLYTPSTLKIETEVSIGITAAASLAIALGPIRGGVYAYFGITVDFQSSTTQGSNLTVGLLLLFRGEVCLLGFLSVSLSLALEAQYSPGGGLVGRGTVSYSIKICWCITINVSASVEYRFGNSGGNARLELTRAERMSMADGAGDVYDLFSGEYVEMFE